ncbi:MAG: metallophosphoesterase [Crocinitomicaceae bacterium]|nr:metallophosphoesterase [Crocinitomicaceae bacterium]
MILFLTIVVLIIGLLEFYCYRGLKAKWKESSNALRIITKTFFWLSLLASFGSIIALFIFGESFEKWQRNFLFAPIMINMFIKLNFAIFLLIDDVRRLIVLLRRIFKKRAEHEVLPDFKISRSEFLLKSGLFASLIPTISYPMGMIYGPYSYKVHAHKVKIKNLPERFHKLKIVQISDIHSGSFYDKEAVNKGIDLILSQKPDVIFFTGDLVNDSADEMKPYIDIFSRLQAPLGVYSVLGNHDYGDYGAWDDDIAKSENFEKVKHLHFELGWRLLMDEHIYLRKGDDKIAVVGVQNWGTGFHQEGDIKKAMYGCDAPVKLLLSHDPTHWDEQVKGQYPDINITFSGHTHGAQMGIETHGFKWSPVSLRYSKWAGLYQEEDQYLYVNRGFGFIGYPGRIGIWPEITVMTLIDDEAPVTYG